MVSKHRLGGAGRQAADHILDIRIMIDSGKRICTELLAWGSVNHSALTHSIHFLWLPPLSHAQIAQRIAQRTLPLSLERFS